MSFVIYLLTYLKYCGKSRGTFPGLHYSKNIKISKSEENAISVWAMMQIILDRLLSQPERFFVIIKSKKQVLLNKNMIVKGNFEIEIGLLLILTVRIRFLTLCFE